MLQGRARGNGTRWTKVGRAPTRQYGGLVGSMAGLSESNEC